MLHAEKAAREAAAEKDKLKQGMESQVEAVKIDLLEQLSKVRGKQSRYESIGGAIAASASLAGRDPGEARDCGSSVGP